jgi:hypothetical protein
MDLRDLREQFQGIERFTVITSPESGAFGHGAFGKKLKLAIAAIGGVD